MAGEPMQACDHCVRNGLADGRCCPARAVEEAIGRVCRAWLAVSYELSKAPLAGVPSEPASPDDSIGASKHAASCSSPADADVVPKTDERALARSVKQAASSGSGSVSPTSARPGHLSDVPVQKKVRPRIAVGKRKSRHAVGGEAREQRLAEPEPEGKRGSLAESSEATSSRKMRLAARRKKQGQTEDWAG